MDVAIKVLVGSQCLGVWVGELQVACYLFGSMDLAIKVLVGSVCMRKVVAPPWHF